MAKIIKEFKDFIAKGNVLDLAVAVIIGAAFGQIVTSLVGDILMPLIGTVLGGLNFSSLALKIGDAQIMYGNFIQSVVNFLIIAASVFLFVKVISRFTKRTAAAPQPVVETTLEKTESTEVALLTQIRDLLKKK